MRGSFLQCYRLSLERLSNKNLTAHAVFKVRNHDTQALVSTCMACPHVLNFARSINSDCMCLTKLLVKYKQSS